MGRAGRAKNPLPELFSQTAWQALGEHFGLSKRQREVAELVCRGHSNREIAVGLRKAPDTVRMHLRGLYDKLDVHDHVGVVVRLVVAERNLRIRPRGVRR